MKQIVAKGQRMGKSTITDIQSIILKQQTLAMSKSIDKMIIDEIWSMDKYRIRKSWTDRRGRKMHRIAANDEVREWLATEHSQYSVSNPDWWKFENQINITDKLYTLLVLRFAE
jgi:hypothetical protein